MTEQSTRILCVDDEPRVLEGLENCLGMHYDVHLATSGAQALQMLAETGPFSVIISDMRMPEMNGATFLSYARQQAPESTRMLLTGYADIDSAAAAVNSGGIFRFLSKPCSPEDIEAAVRDAVQQHDLVVLERDLLQNTLQGAVQVLAELISLTTPAAFDRSKALEGYVRHMSARLGLKDTWEFELAAKMALLGCITLPPDVLKRVQTGHDVLVADRQLMAGHPEIGRRLLRKIPRLERVAAIIARQNQPAAWRDEDPTTDGGMIALGGDMLSVALAFDTRIIAGDDAEDAVKVLLNDSLLNPRLVQFLGDIQLTPADEIVRTLALKELRIGMTLDEDVRSSAGTALVSQGRELTQALLERLHNFAQGVGINEPIRVRIRQPKTSA